MPHRQDNVGVAVLKYENKFLSQGFKLLAGIDEAGRGPLAGPVAAAAVIMPISDGTLIEGINDSKKLSPAKREALYALITEKASAYSVQMCDARVIDEINILEATRLAMLNAVNALNPAPDALLTDFVRLKTQIPQQNITHGDALSYCIAAASILAKVERDRLMLKYHGLYPEYGFDKHKGYGTAAHVAAIKKYGPCPIHRKSFLKKIFLQSDTL
jgi:ribonuclease HII